MSKNVAIPGRDLNTFGIYKGVLPAAKWIPNGMGVAFVIEPPDTSGFSLILPDNAKDKMVTPVGRVVAVGPETKFVKRGDRVLIFNNQPIHNVFFEGQEICVIVEDCVVGVINKPGEGE